MKKLLSVLISLTILLGLAAPFSAFSQEPYEVENPLYARSGLTSPLKGGNIVFIEDSVSYKYKDNTYYTRGRQLYQYAKKKLDARKEVFKLYVLSKDELDLFSATNNITQMVFLGATDDEYCQTSTDSDYIRWAVRSFQTLDVTKNTKKNGYNYYTLTVQFLYYDTLKEEKKADAAVEKYLRSLKLNGKTEYEIVKEIHDYICSINVYDYPAASDPYSHMYAFSSYGALLKGKCVCQGYAVTFYRICKELGFKVRLVSSDPDWGCHAWNIIELDNKYYILDCTWDDQVFDEEDTGIEPYYYFLTDYKSSLKYDSIGQHKLYSSLYENNYFQTNYKNYFAEKPYSSESVKRLSACSVSLSSNRFTYNGNANKPLVTVKDGDVLLKEGEDYTLSYSSNTNPGLGRVDITGIGEYENTNTHRLFIIQPKKVSGLKIGKLTSTSLNLSWGKVSGADGYTVQSFENGKWINLVTSETNSISLSKLSPSSKQKFRIKAFKTVYKHNLYGGVSDNKITYTKPKKGKITSLVAGKSSFTAKFKKLKCSGYQLQYSLSSNMKNAKTLKVSSKKLSKTVKGLKKGKGYYVRIRAFKTFKNEKNKKTVVYGVWSAKSFVKVK